MRVYVVDPYGFYRPVSVPSSRLELIVKDILRELGFSEGIDFFHQYVIPPYVADFAIPSLGLVIEVDGPVHERPWRRRRDAVRDRYLEELGWRVVRISYRELSCRDRVKRRLRRVVEERWCELARLARAPRYYL